VGCFEICETQKLLAIPVGNARGGLLRWVSRMGCDFWVSCTPQRHELSAFSIWLDCGLSKPDWRLLSGYFWRDSCSLRDTLGGNAMGKAQDFALIFKTAHYRIL
jgi:hypothetical protein